MGEGLEVVLWRDAHSYMDPPEEYPHDYLVETVGWVIEGDPKFLLIEGERTPEGPRAVTRIPHGMIVERHPLRRIGGQL